MPPAPITRASRYWPSCLASKASGRSEPTMSMPNTPVIPPSTIIKAYYARISPGDQFGHSFIPPSRHGDHTQRLKRHQAHDGQRRGECYSG